MRSRIVEHGRWKWEHRRRVRVARRWSLACGGKDGRDGRELRLWGIGTLAALLAALGGLAFLVPVPLLVPLRVRHHLAAATLPLLVLAAHVLQAGCFHGRPLLGQSLLPAGLRRGPGGRAPGRGGCRLRHRRQRHESVPPGRHAVGAGGSHGGFRGVRRSRFDNKKEGVRMTLPANSRAVSGARRQLVRAFICLRRAASGTIR